MEAGDARPRCARRIGGRDGLRARPRGHRGRGGHRTPRRVGYLPPPLSRDLAEATAELQEAEFGWRAPAERVVAVGDVIVGLETVIEHFTEPGSAVVVLTPAYMPFLTVPRRMGRAIVEVPLRCTAPGSWELDPERLDAALHGGAGLVVLCNPHNPLGKVYRPDELVKIAEVVERRLRRLFDNTDSARIEQIRIGQRARPADGLPAVGFVSPRTRLYMIATHSGITLAPLLGRLVADELVDGERSPLLADYTPDRLIGKSITDFPKFATLHYPAQQ